jgi:type IV fimbrial biogenesis protein FimT
MSAFRHRGFTLIELMVTATIAIILLLLAMPQYTSFLGDSQIRNASESIASGLRYAQAQAVNRNANAQFVLNAAGWDVMMVDAPAVSIQTASFLEGAKDVTIVALDATPAPATTVAFNALGQVIANATNLVSVDVTHPAYSYPTVHPKRILVGGGRTGVKLCDPHLPTADPQGCPP